MKILAVTDIHGAYGIVSGMLRKESPDILIIGGDLTTVGSVKEAREAIKTFRIHSETIYCISGNMDLPVHDELYSELGISLNGNGIILNNIGFFGVSASPHSPLHTPYEISEEEISRRILLGYEKISVAMVKILVSHTPPFGTKTDIIHSGIHVGSMAVREFIEEKQPDIVICGHIHEARGQDQIEIRKFVICGPALNVYYSVITF